MPQPLFLLGAGFNADTSKEAGQIHGVSLYGEQYRINVGYPLAVDIVRLCADLVSSSGGESPEQMFARALEHSSVPLDKLADLLNKADYYLAQKLASDDTANCYRKFFDTFSHADILTFNYDSLPETFLSRMEKWYPHDGYGVPAAVKMAFGQANVLSLKSSSHVVHLHGSLCIRTSETEIEWDESGRNGVLLHREPPLYTFDPGSISANFRSRYHGPVGDDPVQDRVIAPIPNKAEELKRAFVRESYEQALAMVRDAKDLVAIGYSFNQYDEASYGPILKALAETQGRLVLVSPEALSVATRLRREYPSLEIEPIEKGFANWVAASFRGLS